MAIVQMRKIRVYGLKSEQEMIVDALTRKSVVEVRLLDIGLKALPQNNPEILNVIGDAISYIIKNPKSKKIQLFTRRKTNEETLRDERPIIEKANRVLAIEKEIAALKLFISESRASLLRLIPWLSFDTDVSQLGETRFTISMIGLLSQKAAKRLPALAAKYDRVYIQTVQQSRDCVCLYVVAHKEDSGILRTLAAEDFVQVALPGSSGTPEQMFKRIKSDIAESEKKIKRLQSEAQIAAGALDDMKALYNHYLSLQARGDALEKLGSAENIFIMTGWLPAYKLNEVGSELSKITEAVFIEKTEPDEGEAVPAFLLGAKTLEPVAIDRPPAFYFLSDEMMIQDEH